MNPRTALIAVAALPCFSLSQVTLKMSVDGKPSGTATYRSQIDPKGQILKVLTVSQKGSTASVQFREVRTKSGAPVEQSIQVFGASTGPTSITVSYRAKTVDVNATVGGKLRTTPRAIPPGSQLIDLSDFWFIRDHPKVGATSKFVSFDVQKMTWEPREDTYLGDEPLTVGGRTVKAHKIKGRTSTAWIDDHGLPYRLELSGAHKTVLQRG